MNKDEFISKYHTQKVLKFEPPTWEEFLATATDERWASWFCDDLIVTMNEENDISGVCHTENSFYVFNEKNCRGERAKFNYINDDGIDNREEMYYKALDIAKKWFLGEEV